MSVRKKGTEPLNATTMRNLNDKLYEKRKMGAFEVEALVRDLVKLGNAQDKIMDILLFLQESFFNSSSVSSRKGGLIAIAAAVLGLGNEVDKYLEQVVSPVIQCFSDSDNKVRYYACESMYNITKVIRGGILKYFTQLFDDLCRLTADPDSNVRSAADLLDNLIKEIVTEGYPFDVPKFIGILSKRIHVIVPEARKYLVSWIMVLDAVPEMHLVQYLPQFLEGLFKMLSDPSDEMRNTVVGALFEFLKEIRSKPNKVDFAALVPIVIPQCAVIDQHNFITTLTAMSWISDLINIGKEAILPHSSDLLTAILPCLSHSSSGVENIARTANSALVELIKQTNEPINLPGILQSVQLQFTNQRVPTRLAALTWVLVLQSRFINDLMALLGSLYPALIKMLSDPAEDVVRSDLKVLATLSANDVYFGKLVESLIELFRTDRKLLENRGNLIVRQLSLNISAEKIYRALSVKLESETDPEFAFTVIQTLNLILLTSTELHEVRTRLKKVAIENQEDLFICLYKSWVHNPAALLSLCFLAGVYEHSSDLISKFADLEITVNFLVEIDKLVQLLESPIFLYLRLQLLDAALYPFLIKSLYGILMFLPQSSAYETLKNRLSSVTSSGVLQVIPKSDIKPPSPINIDFAALLQHFVTVQAQHSETLRSKRLAAERVPSTFKKPE